jgi:hypothetical protein
VSKEIGRPPRRADRAHRRQPGARELGYRSYFALKVADYGMTVDDDEAVDDTLATTKPLYDGLHCYRTSWATSVRSRS